MVKLEIRNEIENEFKSTHTVTKRARIYACCELILIIIIIINSNYYEEKIRDTTNINIQKR